MFFTYLILFTQEKQWKSEMTDADIHRQWQISFPKTFKRVEKSPGLLMNEEEYWSRVMKA